MSTTEANKKASSRPGRKPLTTEPKNKRAAQNRAAQRAFRERKERKMKELESKVQMLEDEKLQIANETKLLRNQVDTLVQELSRYRQSSAGSVDLTTASRVTKLTPLPVSATSRGKAGSGSGSVGHTSSGSISGSEHLSSSASESSTSGMSPAYASTKSVSPFESNVGSTPILGGSSASLSSHTPMSSASSTLNMNKQGVDSLSFQFPGAWDNNADSLNGGASSYNKRSLNQTALKGDYNEGVSEFCAELSSVCGSKSCPIPKQTQQQAAEYVSSVLGTPASRSNTTTTPGTTKTDNSPFYDLIQSTGVDKATPGGGDDLSAMFDKVEFSQPNPAFNPNEFLLGDLDDFNKDNDNDSLNGLVTESSKYDPLDVLNTNMLSESIAPQQVPAEFVDSVHSVPGVADTIHDAEEMERTNPDSIETVPMSNEHMMRCSQIWERITAHPRFTEIDIDGLCSELKAKAKCSERGVVVDGEDVGQLLGDAVAK